MEHPRFASWFRGIQARFAALPRQLTVLSLAVMVGIVASTCYLLEQDWLQVRRGDEQILWNQALTATNKIDDAIDGVQIKVDGIITASSVASGQARARAQMADALRIEGDEIAALMGMDATGHVVASTSPHFKPGEDLSNLDAFQSVIRTGSVSLGAPVTIGGEQWLPLARPLRAADGSKLVGTMWLRLSYLEKIALASHTEPRNLVVIFELGGPQITRTPNRPGSDAVAIGHSLTATLGSADSVSSITVSKVDQVDRLSVLMRAGQFSLAALVAVPVSALWQSWWPQAIGIIGMAGALLAIMIIFHFVLATELTRRQKAERGSAALAEEANRFADQYRLLAEHSSDVVVRLGIDGVCRYASPAMESMLGWTPEELVGHDISHLMHPDDLGLLERNAQVLIEGAGEIRTHFRHLHRDGRYLSLECNMQLVARDGVPESFVSSMRDISDRVEAEQKLAEAAAEMARLAATDQLTGLANRRRFNEELQREWRRTAREELPLSVLLFDVDFFKSYNDTYGHQGGDVVLKAVAAAVTAALHRPSDLVARWGGEEFVVLLPATDVDGAIGVAEIVRATIEALQIPHCGSTFGYLSVSVGVATSYPCRNQSPEPLIAEADANLYLAKGQGRNRVGAPPTNPMIWAGMR